MNRKENGFTWGRNDSSVDGVPVERYSFSLLGFAIFDIYKNKGISHWSYDFFEFPLSSSFWCMKFRIKNNWNRLKQEATK